METKDDPAREALRGLVERLCIAVAISDDFLRGRYDMESSPLYLVRDAAAEANYLLDMRDAIAAAEGAMGGKAEKPAAGPWRYDLKNALAHTHLALLMDKQTWIPGGRLSDGTFTNGFNEVFPIAWAEINTEVSNGRD